MSGMSWPHCLSCTCVQAELQATHHYVALTIPGPPSGLDKGMFGSFLATKQFYLGHTRKHLGLEHSTDTEVPCC